jgi:hypothetical protein
VDNVCRGYLPLIEELKRTGTQVWLGALSSGLNVTLRRSVDRFIDLDKWLFMPEENKAAG